MTVVSDYYRSNPPNSYRLPILSVPTICMDMECIRTGHTTGRVTRCVKRTRGTYWYGRIVRVPYYIIYIGNRYWGGMISFFDGNVFLEGNKVMRQSLSSGYVVLDKEKLKNKKRSCRMCISDCNSKICGLYDPIWRYIPDATE